MRKPPLGPTTPQRVVSCVLLVGIGSELEAFCRQCAAVAVGARLEVCDVASATTKSAEWRPIAIVVPQEILEFDPDEFEALARTVNATLVSLDTHQKSSPALKGELVAAIRAAHVRRG